MLVGVLIELLLEKELPILSFVLFLVSSLKLFLAGFVLCLLRPEARLQVKDFEIQLLLFLHSFHLFSLQPSVLLLKPEKILFETVLLLNSKIKLLLE